MLWYNYLSVSVSSCIPRRGRIMRKEGLSMFRVVMLIGAAIDWLEARCLAVWNYFHFNLYREKSRVGKRLLKAYRAL